LKTEFFDLCSEVLCIVGSDGRILAANPAFRRAFGGEASELQSRTFQDLVHVDDRAAVDEAFAAASSSGRDIEVVSRHRSRDDVYLPVEWRGRVGPESGILYLVGADVTERRMAEHARHELTSRYEALFENAAQGILWIDVAGRILSFNAMAERIFGYRREEMVGKKLEVLMPEKLAETHERHRRQYFEDPQRMAASSPSRSVSATSPPRAEPSPSPS